MSATSSTETLESAAPELIERRRSIRKLADGPLPADALRRLTDAIERSPASMGTTPWHIVLLRERRAEFWTLVESAFREHLSGEQLDRYLARLDGFRPAGIVALVFEDLAVRDALMAKGISEEMAIDFNLQGLGIVQHAIWLTATEMGLGASLQHWNAQLAAALPAFTGLDPARYRIIAQIPIGIPAEVPGPRNPERAPGWSVDAPAIP
ncbi:MAG: nitroreductase family protein [Thermomicrobiales bacterium]